MEDNIVLIGLMGAGKTTIGEFLAQKLSKNFVDFDSIIEQNTKMSINKIFEIYGENYFRNLEKETIKKYQNCKNTVISTGGGIVKDIENINNLKKIGKVIYLQASPDVLYERIKEDNKRPLLNCEDSLTKLKILFDERHSNYELADIIVNTENKNINSIAKEINEKINC